MIPAAGGLRDDLARPIRLHEVCKGIWRATSPKRRGRSSRIRPQAFFSRLPLWLLSSSSSKKGHEISGLTGGDLVFGGRYIEDGLWQIGLEDLAEASWKPVRGARISGKPAS